MLGAAVWHDKQGTTVNSDESPRERPLQPLPRHRAAAFPIEPATRARPSRGEGAARGGGRGGAGGVTSARREAGARAGPSAAAPGASRRLRRLAVVLSACSGQGLDTDPSQASPTLSSGSGI